MFWSQIKNFAKSYKKYTTSRKEKLSFKEEYF